MAIAVEVTFKGPDAKFENYIKGLTILGAVPEGKHPDDDCLFHWVKELDVQDGGPGLQVIDVWTSKAEFEDFLPKVKAANEQAGLPRPDIKYIDVLNFLTAGS